MTDLKLITLKLITFELFKNFNNSTMDSTVFKAQFVSQTCTSEGRQHRDTRSAASGAGH